MTPQRMDAAARFRPSPSTPPTDAVAWNRIADHILAGGWDEFDGDDPNAPETACPCGIRGCKFGVGAP